MKDAGVTQTTYTYSQSFAVAICEGTIAGVRKIWANGKLIYNLSDTADIATIIASNKSAEGIRIYTGSETQTADSLIQANIGAADTPAYRGTAYVLFENLQLADYGNRMPNLEFEVVVSGVFNAHLGDTTNYTNTVGTYNEKSICYDPVTDSMWVGSWGLNSLAPRITKINPSTGVMVNYALPTSRYATTVCFDSKTSSLWVLCIGYSYPDPCLVLNIDIHTGSVIAEYQIGNYVAGGGNFVNGMVLDPSGFLWIGCANPNILQKFDIKTHTILSFDALAPYDTWANYNGQAVTYDNETHSVWMSNYSTPSISVFNALTGVRNDISFPLASGNVAANAVFDNVSKAVWVGCRNGALYKFDVHTFARTDYMAPAGLLDGVGFDPDTKTLWFSTGQSTYVRFDIGTGTFVTVTNLPLSPGSWAYDPTRMQLWVSDRLSYSVAKVETHAYGMAASAPILSSVVSNICTRAGLTTNQIDVTALTDTVDGYVVQRGTARSQIEQLMQAFYFDAVESDGKIKFVKRGGAAALNIPEDDLAAHAYGSTMPDNLVTTRKQEMELPLEFDVQFMDKSANYAVGSQRSSRLTTSSQNKISVNFAISMSASKAKQVCDVLMYDAWTGRTTFNFTTGWKYSYLEPTDVITVTKGTTTYTARVTGDDLNVGVSSRQAAFEDSTVYTQTAVAAEQLAPINTVSTVPLTDLLLLDIPLLRDQDDAVGFYAAACGYGAGWKGAQIYKSNDNGASWDVYGNAFLHAATIGTTGGVLGTFASGNIFDETNTVSVVLINGTLASDTEINILNGANVALLGNEIIQFKNATLTATNTYTLSSLLRGRQGTEWAISTHVAGDRFVLFSLTTTGLFPASSAEYNLARKYRGVSIGTFLSDAADIDFTNTAVAQKPLSPVLIGGGRDSSGNITINWTRRTRMGGGWNNNADVPLGEATESYSIDVYDSTFTTLLTTLKSTTPSVIYSGNSTAGLIAVASAASTAMQALLQNGTQLTYGSYYSVNFWGTGYYGAYQAVAIGSYKFFSITSSGTTASKLWDYTTRYVAMTQINAFSVKATPTTGWSLKQDGTPMTSDPDQYDIGIDVIRDHRDSATEMIFTTAVNTCRITFTPPGGVLHSIYKVEPAFYIVPSSSLSDANPISVTRTPVVSYYTGIPAQFDSVSNFAILYVASPPLGSVSPAKIMSSIIFGNVIYTIALGPLTTYSTSGKTVDITNLITNHLTLADTVGPCTYRHTLSGGVITPLDARAGMFFADRVTNTDAVEWGAGTLKRINMTTGATISTFSMGYDIIALAGDWSNSVFYTLNISGLMRKHDLTGAVLRSIDLSSYVNANWLSTGGPGIDERGGASIHISTGCIYLFCPDTDATRSGRYRIAKDLTTAANIIDPYKMAYGLPISGSVSTIIHAKPDTANSIITSMTSLTVTSSLGAEGTSLTSSPPIGVKIYQISSTIGRGFAGIGTV